MGKLAACEIQVAFPDGYVPLTSIDINEDYKLLMTGQTLQLDYTKNPTDASANRFVWSSTNPTVVSVDENGLATALKNGQADIVVTSVGENKMNYCRIFSVATDLLGTVSFLDPAKTWNVGDGKVWSDVVVAERCEGKTTFNGGSFTAVATMFEFLADCRDNTTAEKDYGHLFSWTAVEAFQHEMCPAPWRLPTVDDFIALDKALGGTGESAYNSTLVDAYTNTWGGMLCGFVNGPTQRDVGKAAQYWSSSPPEYSFEEGGFHNIRTLRFNIAYDAVVNGTPFSFSAESSPRGALGKNNGAALRCVKDE
jgi:uncharacterized protein (TIGR02145 family)